MEVTSLSAYREGLEVFEDEIYTGLLLGAYGVDSIVIGSNEDGVSEIYICVHVQHINGRLHARYIMQGDRSFLEAASLEWVPEGDSRNMTASVFEGSHFDVAITVTRGDCYVTGEGSFQDCNPFENDA